MATQKIVLNPFNSLNLSAGTQYNLVAPGPGHYAVDIMNRGTTDLAISNANTVSLSDPASYTLPGGTGDLRYSASIWGSSGIWVAGTVNISVALVPRS